MGHTLKRMSTDITDVWLLAALSQVNRLLVKRMTVSQAWQVLAERYVTCVRARSEWAE